MSEMNRKEDSNQRRPHHRRGRVTFRVFCLSASVIIIILISVLISSAIKNGRGTAAEAYKKAKEAAKEEAYNEFYNLAFASAERDYHVSNRALIDVEVVKEEAQLEVLKVYDVEYVINPAIVQESGAEIWAEYSGEGVFTVDMKKCEFIIDNEHQYVLVRIPNPVLSHCKITNVTPLLLKDGILNKSTGLGADFAESMMKVGDSKLKSYMKSNSKFYSAAKKSAKTIISDLVKSLNPELPQLVVDVEFVE